MSFLYITIYSGLWHDILITVFVIQSVILSYQMLDTFLNFAAIAMYMTKESSDFCEKTYLISIISKLMITRSPSIHLAYAILLASALVTTIRGLFTGENIPADSPGPVGHVWCHQSWCPSGIATWDGSDSLKIVWTHSSQTSENGDGGKHASSWSLAYDVPQRSVFSHMLFNIWNHWVRSAEDLGWSVISMPFILLSH